MSKVPTKMPAVLLKGHGGFEQLEFRTDVQVPKPRAGEVLVAIGAAGVNNTDINTRTAWYSRGVSEGTTESGAAAGYASANASDSGWTGAEHSFPRIQGADACGRIAAVGTGVPDERIGQRVLLEPVIRYNPGDVERVIYFGSECDGAFAGFAVIPAANAHPIHSTLTDAELASFPCSYGAAEHMIERCGVARGERVLVTGASGGVGSAAVQLAARRGARVIAVVSPTKASAVESLGASTVIARDADVVAALGAESVEVVIDVVGGRGFGGLLEVLRRRGRYAVAGAISGPLVELDLRTLYLKDLRFEGCTVFPPQVFRNLITYIERGEIRPVVASVHPLRDIVRAQQEFASKAHTGKIVLIP